MLKLVALPLSGLVLVGSVGAVMQEQDPVPAPGAMPVLEIEQPAAPVVPEREPPISPLQEVLGLTVGAVSAELRAHLGLPGGHGLVVTDVRDGSRAAEVGLMPYDVLLTVNQEPAQEGLLLESLNAARGLELAVIRKGVLQHVMLNQSGVPASTGFLSSATLPANHPFRRYQAYHDLRTAYSERLEQYSELLKDVDQESRRARDEARAARDALQEQCEAQVAENLAAFEAELRAHVDERLDESILAPLWDLTLDLDELLLPDHQEEIVELREQAKARLHQDFSASVAAISEGAPRSLVQRHQQRMQTLGQEMAHLYSQRTDSTWSQALREIHQHDERIGRRHDDRMKWATRTVNQIRGYLHERIKCAVERTNTQFSKRLKSRLSDMQVPAPGEIDGCVSDAREQIEAMAERFLWRTEEALDEYWSQVSSANEALIPAAEKGLDGGSQSFATLDQSFEAILTRTASLRLDANSEEWVGRGQVDDIYHRLRSELRGAVNDGRDAVRDACVPMVSQFRDHKVVAEDSWRDLERLLSEIKGQANDDCWKLDGPHLDGRFPKPETEKKKQKKGELALLSR